MPLMPGFAWDAADRAVQTAIENGLSAYLYARDLGDGRGVWVMPMIGPNARLVVGDVDGGLLDAAYCYDSGVLAVTAAMVWDGSGEPEGWKRHVNSGRRRPGGDPALEYVQP